MYSTLRIKLCKITAIEETHAGWNSNERFQQHPSGRSQIWLNKRINNGNSHFLFSEVLRLLQLIYSVKNSLTNFSPAIEAVSRIHKIICNKFL